MVLQQSLYKLSCFHAAWSQHDYNHTAKKYYGDLNGRSMIAACSIMQIKLLSYCNHAALQHALIQYSHILQSCWNHTAQPCVSIIQTVLASCCNHAALQYMVTKLQSYWKHNASVIQIKLLSCCNHTGIMLIAFFYESTHLFVSDLVGNPTTGFLASWLIFTSYLSCIS